MSGDLRLLNVVMWGGKVDGLNWLAAGIIDVEYPICSLGKVLRSTTFLLYPTFPFALFACAHMAFSKL